MMRKDDLCDCGSRKPFVFDVFNHKVQLAYYCHQSRQMSLPVENEFFVSLYVGPNQNFKPSVSYSSQLSHLLLF